MAKAKLNCDAYMHKSASEGRFAKFKSGFSRERLKAGSEFDVLPQHSGAEGMTAVQLLSWPGNSAPKNWRANDKGFIRTAKLTMSSGAIRDQQLLLNNQSGNGLGGGAGINGMSYIDILQEEIEVNMAFWQAIEEVLDLCMNRETNAAYWSPKVKKLGTLQMLCGATMLGLAVAAIIVSAGAATPLFVAFGIASISTTGAGIGSSIGKGKLKAGTGLASDTSTGNKMAAKGATRDVVITGAVIKSKSEIIPRMAAHHLGEGASQAAKASAEHSIGLYAGAAGGAYQMYGGYKTIRMGDKINPMAAWDAVDWQEIVGALTQDYIKLQDAYDCYPSSPTDLRKFVSFRSSFLPQAEKRLNTLIGKINKALILSRHWRKGHVDVTKLSSPTSSSRSMPGIAWDNCISSPTLQSSTNTQATIPIAEAQRRFVSSS